MLSDQERRQLGELEVRLEAEDPRLAGKLRSAADHTLARLFVAGIFGLTGLLSVAGRILFGVAADRIGRAPAATISYGCTALGTLCLLGLELWPHAGVAPSDRADAEHELAHVTRPDEAVVRA